MNGDIELKNQQRELQHFRFRLAIAAGAGLLLFFLLFARFYYLQVIQHDYYSTLAENNRISILPVVPNRGLILDHNGVVLANNFPAYTLEITPSKVDDLDELINQLNSVVEITPKDRKRFRKLMEQTKNLESLPIRTRLNDVEVARFAANHYRFPAVDIKARLFRHYPLGAMTSHVIGYISRINDDDMDWLEEKGELANYRGTEYIGKSGIEQSYEMQLHGKTGFEQVEIDANGRVVRTLSRIPPISGDNLLLTLDARLQEFADKAFGNNRGALVAIEPSSGGVLAFVSKPGFDPNLFVDGIDPQNWDALNNSPDKPLTNRALDGQYPPGSTFKPFLALAGLELNKRTPQYSIFDPGYFTLPGSTHRYRDWKAGGHGWVDLHKSLVESCDTYYYGLAYDLGIENIHSFISRFGLGQKTGIDVEGEGTGLLPSEEWKLKRYREKWFAGDTVSVGIGQGYDLVTPLQLANAMALIANNGIAFRPHLVRYIQDSRTGQLKSIASEVLYDLNLKPANLALVQKALVDVTRPGGTAARAGANSAYPIAGKTGTAQVIAFKQNEKYDEKKVAERQRDHALFIAYAPADNPQIALAVIVENGGHGASTAAPLAREVLDFYLLGKRPQNSLPSPSVKQESND
ncbi:MAG TPA: penicillin-binding protein 2 [Burkholderiales bacterium]|nr:penicillin-binding protein 2 [Burkholderiales bacterium]